MEEEKEGKKVGERRTQAQRLKRVLAETTPKHLEQLTKQARALAGEDVEDDVCPSLATTRAKLTGLQQSLSQLREQLSGRERFHAEQLQSSFEYFPKFGIPVHELGVQEWNDSLISTMCPEVDVTNNRSSEEISKNRGYQFDATKLPCHLPGKTICRFIGGYIGVKFETSYGGKSFESYYCVLGRKANHENLYVGDNSIPFFLPLHDIEMTRLNTSVTDFIDHLFQVLQAYVSRREQIGLFQDSKDGKIRNFYCSSAYNLIELSIQEPDCMLEVSLAYDNFESELPTRALVSLRPHKGDPKASTDSGSRATGSSFSQHIAPWVQHAEDELKRQTLLDAYDDAILKLHHIMESPSWLSN